MERKRIAQPGDEIVKVICPISDEEADQRKADRTKIGRTAFGIRHRMSFEPVRIIYKGREYAIQVNFCTDPWCMRFTQPQADLKPNPNSAEEQFESRYGLSGADHEPLASDEGEGEDDDSPADTEPAAAAGLQVATAGSRGASTGPRPAKRRNSGRQFHCNPENFPTSGLGVSKRSFSPMSNWSLADEIARLATYDSVVALPPPVYTFHKDVNGVPCDHEGTTPSDRPDLFVKRGTSTSRSRRWQCRGCQKITHTQPALSFTYGQQRSEVLPKLAKMIMAHMPISQACDALCIGRGTYYNKLEQLATRCLEFQQEYEREPLSTKEFGDLWICSDQMVYQINNLIRPDQGRRGSKAEPRQIATRVVVTADIDSGFVFRSDLAYDWDVTTDDIRASTRAYSEDCLDTASRHYSRLRRLTADHPIPDKATLDAMPADEVAWLVAHRREFENRRRYYPGIHVKDSYTTFAGLWLLKHLIKAGRWFIVCDEDNGLQTAIFRAFADEIYWKNAHVITATLPKMGKREEVRQANREAREARDELTQWALAHGFGFKDLDKAAVSLMEARLRHDPLYRESLVNGVRLKIPVADPSRKHPFPMAKEPQKTVTCLTDISDFSLHDQAETLVRAESRSADRFIEAIRRRLNLLERPIDSGRTGKSSYIYANINAEYAYMALVVLRTFFNFCVKTPSPIRKPKKDSPPAPPLTPAMRLKLVDHPFHIEDIIYYR